MPEKEMKRLRTTFVQRVEARSFHRSRSEWVISALATTRRNLGTISHNGGDDGGTSTNASCHHSRFRLVVASASLYPASVKLDRERRKHKWLKKTCLHSLFLKAWINPSVGVCCLCLWMAFRKLLSVGPLPKKQW